jgi:hypothetical protein
MFEISGDGMRLRVGPSPVGGGVQVEILDGEEGVSVILDGGEPLDVADALRHYHDTQVVPSV